MPTRANALVRETSPYLLQHAHNPVDWYAWGDEAFQLAQSTDRPIFLSVGYSTCYWCHVMEREVFENGDIAALMNAQFVNVKVDREERPDVDDLYMTAVQMMTRHGGWPMSVFLTPPSSRADEGGLLPFYAGTYFPPEPRHGMPGFPQILTSIAAAWRERREEVLTQATQVADAVRAHFVDAVSPSRDPAPDLVGQAAAQISATYDSAHGGFGPAPKFPQPCTHSFLLGTGEITYCAQVIHTLKQMAHGGIYDQLGGGFHRYSTDAKWLVPHFEKMLYDNAQLVVLYAELAGDTTGSDARLFERITRETCDYVLGELRDQTGTFWSAQDAEVGAREGANYLWTEEEVRAALDDGELAETAVTFFGLDRGPNFRDPHHPEDRPRSVLFLPASIETLAETQGRSVDEVVRMLETIRAELHRVRVARQQPRTDDKVLASWNGMMIGALAVAGSRLAAPQYLDAARLAARYILDHFGSTDGGVLHSMRDGDVRIDGFLEDYAYLVDGLVRLARATDEEEWAQEAVRLDRVAKERFRAATGGYYDTLADRSDLFVRTRSMYDGAVPTANSQMVHNQIELFEQTGETEYLRVASADVAAFAHRLNEAPLSLVHMVHAVAKLREYTADDDAMAGAPVVQARIEPPGVDRARRVAELDLALDISVGHHLAVTEGRSGGTLEITVEDAAGVELETVLPEPDVAVSPLADEPMRIYRGTVTICLVLRLTTDASWPANFTVLVSYQACTDSVCLVPAVLRLPVSVV